MVSLYNVVATSCNQSFSKSQRGGNLQLQSSCDQLQSSPVASLSEKLQLDFKTLLAGTNSKVIITVIVAEQSRWRKRLHQVREMLRQVYMRYIRRQVKWSTMEVTFKLCPNMSSESNGMSVPCLCNPDKNLLRHTQIARATNPSKWQENSKVIHGVNLRPEIRIITEKAASNSAKGLPHTRRPCW